LKGFIITMVLFVAGGFLLLTQYGEISQFLVDKMAVQEGNHEVVVAASVKSPSDFQLKYGPLLDRRWMLGQGAVFLDETWFLKLSKETLDLYAETPLALSQSYANFMFERAKRIELTGDPRQAAEAFNLYKAHRDNFPNDEHAKLVINAISRMITKYGMQ
jgi:hypothetical protein